MGGQMPSSKSIGRDLIAAGHVPDGARKPWVTPAVILSEMRSWTDKLSTSQEMHIDPGYAYPRTLGPS